MKSFIISLITIISLTALTPNPTMAQSIDYQTKLETQIGKIIYDDPANRTIATQVLKPGFFFGSFADGDPNGWSNDNLARYWHNPAETTITLIRAYYQLGNNPNLQADIKTYIETHFGPNGTYPITTLDYIGYNQANTRSRSSYIWPAEISINRSLPTVWNRKLNPINFYAAWKYALLFQNDDPNIASTLFTQMAILTPPKEDGFYLGPLDPTVNPVTPPSINALPGALNVMISGYYGYIKLASLAGQQSGSQQSTYTNLLSLRTQLMNSLSPVQVSRINIPGSFTYPDNHILGTEAGGYIGIVPEVADEYFKQEHFSTVQTSLNTYNDSMPYWFVSKADEQLKTGVKRGAGLGNSESANTPLYAGHAFFQAHANILGKTKQELEPYLDVPSVERGDLYYIDNLVAYLEAPDGAGISNTPTPSTPGDANGDGLVDGIDYIIWLNNYNQSTVNGPADGDFNSSGLVDGVDYIIWLNNYSYGGGPQVTPTPTPGGSTGIQVGVGGDKLDVAYPPWPTTPINPNIQALATRVVSDAKANYGAGDPKLIIMTSNAGNSVDNSAPNTKAGSMQYLYNEVTTQFGTNPIIIGEGTSSENYNSFTSNSSISNNNSRVTNFFPRTERSSAVLALGGDDITNISVATPVAIDRGTDTTAAQANIIAGEQLAQNLINSYPALHPSNTGFDSTQNQLIYIFGSMHNPIMPPLLCGFKEVFYSPDPNNPIDKCDENSTTPEASDLNINSAIKIIASGSYYNSRTLVNGISSDADYVSAVLIKGTYGLELAGQAGIPDNNANLTLQPLVANNPELVFMVPGHPVDYSAVETQISSVLAGKTTQLFGHEGANETGHFTTTGQPEGVTQTYFFATLKGN